MFDIYQTVISYYKKQSEIRYEKLCAANKKNTDHLRGNQFEKENKAANVPKRAQRTREMRQAREAKESRPKSPPEERPIVSSLQPQKVFQVDRPIKQSKTVKIDNFTEVPIKAPVEPTRNSNVLRDENQEKPDRPLPTLNKPLPSETEQPDDGNVELFQCPEGCGRSFNKKALAKHAKVCKKVFQEKRKEFHASEQREIEQVKELGNIPKKKTTEQKNQAKDGKSKWLLESLVFRANIKRSKGLPLTKQQEEALNQPSPDTVQCNFCSRRFNKAAAEKHIPLCEKKSKKR